MSKLRMVSTWVACDLDTPAGRQLARSAVVHVKSSNQMRVAFIHNNHKNKEPGEFIVYSLYFYVFLQEIENMYLDR